MQQTNLHTQEWKPIMPIMLGKEWKPIMLSDMPTHGDLIGQQHSDGTIKKHGIVLRSMLRAHLSTPPNLLNGSSKVQARESWNSLLDDRDETYVYVLDVDYGDGNQVTEILCDVTTTQLGIGPRLTEDEEGEWFFDFIDKQQTEPITWVVSKPNKEEAL